MAAAPDPPPTHRARPSGGVPARMRGAWRRLVAEQRHAAIAAAALFVSMLLPWYQKSYVPKGATVFVNKNVSAFGAFSFIEAAVLLVAAGVLYLLFARAERRAFHLPGGDGAVIMVAGAWATLLIFIRLFDKPEVSSSGKAAATVGIQWGIFFALAAAGALAFEGARLRGAHQPEPPLHRRGGDVDAGSEGPAVAPREPRPPGPSPWPDPGSRPAPTPAPSNEDLTRPLPPQDAPTQVAPEDQARTRVRRSADPHEPDRLF